MKTISIAITAITLFNFSTVLHAAPHQAMIPAKAVVPLILDQELRSGREHVGDEVRYRTIADVKDADGDVLIPAGAIAHGVVQKSDASAKFGKGGKMEISCDYVEAPDGTHIAFADPDFTKHGTSTLGTTPMILLPFTKGKEVELHKGMVLTMAVATDTPIKGMTTAPSALPLDVIEGGRHKKAFRGTVKSCTTNDIVFATDSDDKDLPVKNIDSITVAQ